jgi:hypothetical protein
VFRFHLSDVRSEEADYLSLVVVQVAQLADEFKSSVQFWHMVADPDKYMVAEMLQVRDALFVRACNDFSRRDIAFPA